MRKMKKIIAFLVAVVVFAGNFNSLVTHAQETAWGDITSVTAEVVEPEFYEGTNGYYATRDVNGTPEQFYYYDYLPEYEFTVNYADGNFEQYNSNDLHSAFYPKYGSNQISYDNSGQYENPWGVGQHTYQLTILGHQVDLEVNILERPFESFAVIPEYASVKENTHGNTQQRWDDATQEYVSCYEVTFVKNKFKNLSFPTLATFFLI